MAQSWGRRLGIIKMSLVFQNGKWVVQKDKTTVESRGYKYKDGVTSVAADAAIAPAIATEHAATIAYAKQPIGVSTDFEMSSYFSMVGDVTAIQLVNQAQIDYVEDRHRQQHGPGDLDLQEHSGHLVQRAVQGRTQWPLRLHGRGTGRHPCGAGRSAGPQPG
jgi:2',3'-cyclic-nucleotide 2'-phosphodiesterase (5'-nucleotidase family)